VVCLFAAVRYWVSTGSRLSDGLPVALTRHVVAFLSRHSLRRRISVQISAFK